MPSEWEEGYKKGYVDAGLEYMKIYMPVKNYAKKTLEQIKADMENVVWNEEVQECIEIIERYIGYMEGDADVDSI